MADEMEELKKALEAQKAIHRAASSGFLTNLKQSAEEMRRLHEESGRILDDKTTEAIERSRLSWRKLVETAVYHFKDKMADTAKKMGGPGGFGEIGTKFGQLMGSSISETVGRSRGWDDAKLKLGKAIGGAAGAGFIDALQAMESYRILGAKFVQTVTAGHYFRDDFLNVGGTLTTQVLQIQKETGAARERIFEIADQLSKLGIAFDETGMKGTQYMIAAEKVFNLQEGLITSLTDTAIRRYGERWEDVGEVLKDTAETTSAWRQQTEDLDKSVLGNIASTNILTKMYSQLAIRMKESGVEMTAMNKVMLASVGVMGEMGMRPGQMRRVINDFMAALAPGFQSFDKTLETSFWYNRLLNFTEQGATLANTVSAYGAQQGIPKQMFSVAMQQYLSQDQTGDVSLSLFANLLEGIATEQSTYPGNKQQQFAQMSYTLDRAFGFSPVITNAAGKLGELIKEARASGLSDAESFKAIAQNPTFKELANKVGAGDNASIETVFGLMFNMGKASLSVEQKISLAAEGISAWAASWGKLGDLVSIIGEDIGPGATNAGQLNNISTRQRLGAVEGAVKNAGVFTGEMPEKTQLDKPRRKIPIGGITKSTAHGIEQETWSVYDEYIEEYAQKYNIDPNIAKRQMREESRGTGGHLARSPVGAMGVGQIMPKTWASLSKRMQKEFPGARLNPYNPRHNVAASMSLMRENLNRYGGDYRQALNAYHGGTNPANWGRKTRSYSSKILSPTTPGDMANYFTVPRGGHVMGMTGMRK